MSYTELYAFGKDGNAKGIGEVKNAWRGAMAIWGIIEKRYLKPLPRPVFMSIEDYKQRGYSRCSAPPFGSENPMSEIWKVFDDKNISDIDKIVLGTTFDNAVVMHDNIQETINAFIEFEGESSVKEQAELITAAIKGEELIGIAWNQTSVCGDTWTNFNYDEENEEYTPYNLLTMDKHFDLFEEILKTNEKV